MGGIKAVTFDWSGTVVDFGSRGPVAAFVATFADHCIAIRNDEARGPMGLGKRRHVEAVAEAVGVTLSGSGAGLNENDLARLDVSEVSRLRNEAGAHLVIDTVAGLPAAIDDITGRLATGRTPHDDRENGR